MGVVQSQMKNIGSKKSFWTLFKNDFQKSNLKKGSKITFLEQVFFIQFWAPPIFKPHFLNRFESSYEKVLVSFNNISTHFCNPMTFYFRKFNF